MSQQPTNDRKITQKSTSIPAISGINLETRPRTRRSTNASTSRASYRLASPISKLRGSSFFQSFNKEINEISPTPAFRRESRFEMARGSITERPSSPAGPFSRPTMRHRRSSVPMLQDSQMSIGLIGASPAYGQLNGGPPNGGGRPPAAVPSRCCRRPNARQVLVVLLFLVAGLCMLVACLDLILQTSADLDNDAKPDAPPWSLNFVIGPKTFVVGGAYILTLLCSLFIILNRAISVQGAIDSIPKLGVPLKKENLPRNMFKIVQRGLARVKTIPLDPLPPEVHHNGWIHAVTASKRDAKPTIENNERRSFAKILFKKNVSPRATASLEQGPDEIELEQKTTLFTELTQPVHLRRAALHTWTVLDKHVQALRERLESTLTSSSSSENHTIQVLQVLEKNGWSSIPDHLKTVGEVVGVESNLIQYFLSKYNKARFAKEEIQPEEYEAMMKCLVLIVKK